MSGRVAVSGGDVTGHVPRRSTLIQSKRIDSSCLFYFFLMHPQRKSYMVINGRNYGPVYHTYPLYLEAHFHEKSACYIRSFTVLILVCNL